ncbi:MAG: PD-(D/E)XK nuclease domain-containing protein, partial [Clostridiales bacterium]|nr:PD-(D/E)XK nuclease domain-containing protein [Clostridiales bacterium]
DFDEKEPEKTYHVAVLFLLSAMGLKVTSNKESGLGRYDILLELPESSIIFEFKLAKDKTLASLKAAAQKALAQIDEREYWRGCNLAVPLYKIGVGFSGKVCSSVYALRRETDKRSY